MLSSISPMFNGSEQGPAKPASPAKPTQSAANSQGPGPGGPGPGPRAPQLRFHLKKKNLFFPIQMQRQGKIDRNGYLNNNQKRNSESLNKATNNSRSSDAESGSVNLQYQVQQNQTQTIRLHNSNSTHSNSENQNIIQPLPKQPWIIPFHSTTKFHESHQRFCENRANRRKVKKINFDNIQEDALGGYGSLTVTSCSSEVDTSEEEKKKSRKMKSDSQQSNSSSDSSSDSGSDSDSSDSSDNSNVKMSPSKKTPKIKTVICKAKLRQFHVRKRRKVDVNTITSVEHLNYDKNIAKNVNLPLTENPSDRGHLPYCYWPLSSNIQSNSSSSFPFFHLYDAHKMHRKFVVVKNFVSLAEIDLIHKCNDHWSVEEIKDRKANLQYRHTAYRVELQMKYGTASGAQSQSQSGESDNSQSQQSTSHATSHLYRKIMECCHTIDEGLWRKLPVATYPELEYIVYDTKAEVTSGAQQEYIEKMKRVEDGDQGQVGNGNGSDESDEDEEEGDGNGNGGKKGAKKSKSKKGANGLIVSAEKKTEVTAANNHCAERKNTRPSSNTNVFHQKCVELGLKSKTNLYNQQTQIQNSNGNQINDSDNHHRLNLLSKYYHPPPNPSNWHSKTLSSQLPLSQAPAPPPAEHPPYIEEHVDNDAVLTFIIMLSKPKHDFLGGRNNFARGAKHCIRRTVELEQGDMVLFRGERLRHSITPVTHGVRVILQGEFSKT